MSNAVSSKDLTTWQPIASAPEGVEVMTKVELDDTAARNIQSMVRKGRLWFFPDMSMYVYYTPTHWRPL
jgi:hypothetical protein